MFNQSLLREMASPEAKPCHVAPVPVTRAASEGYLNEYLDATFVRALLVPATMRLLGNLNWWLPFTGVQRHPPALAEYIGEGESEVHTTQAMQDEVMK